MGKQTSYYIVLILLYSYLIYKYIDRTDICCQITLDDIFNNDKKRKLEKMIKKNKKID